VPSGFGVPLAADLKVELPEKMEIVQADGSTKNSSEVAWEVPAGSEMRLQQMLAELGYLPYKFTGEIVAKPRKPRSPPRPPRPRRATSPRAGATRPPV